MIVAVLALGGLAVLPAIAAGGDDPIIYDRDGIPLFPGSPIPPGAYVIDGKGNKKPYVPRKRAVAAKPAATKTVTKDPVFKQKPLLAEPRMEMAPGIGATTALKPDTTPRALPMGRDLDKGPKKLVAPDLVSKPGNEVALEDSVRLPDAKFPDDAATPTAKPKLQSKAQSKPFGPLGPIVESWPAAKLNSELARLEGLAKRIAKGQGVRINRVRYLLKDGRAFDRLQTSDAPDLQHADIKSATSHSFLQRKPLVKALRDASGHMRTLLAQRKAAVK